MKSLATHTASAVLGALLVIIIGLKPSVTSDIFAEQTSQQKEILDDIVQKHEEIQNQFKRLFDDDFFAQKKPFESMRKMREKIIEDFKKFDDSEDSNFFLNNPFDSWFSNKFGGGTAYDINKREDDKFVYYDIIVPDLESTTVNTKVEKGHIEIKGRFEKLETSEGSDGEISSRRQFSSSFSRVFPLPPSVDTDKVETIVKNDRITIKFPKVKSV